MPHAEKPLLIERVVRIIDDDFERVSEHGDGFNEFNPMLGRLLRCLRGIPFNCTAQVYWSSGRLVFGITPALSAAATHDHTHVRCKAVSGRLLTAILHKVDLVRCAPLPERSLGALGFECIPSVEALFRRQQFLETSVGSAMPEARRDVRISMRQLRVRKPKREIVPQVEVVLVWNRDVPIGCFKIVG